MSSLKDYLRKKLPESFIRALYSKILHPYLLRKSVTYDRRRFLKYSDNFLMNNDVLLIGNIIKHYHVVEKGLTMPEPRLGFGQDNLVKLIRECKRYIELYGSKDSQLQHAIAVIEEYRDFHKSQGYILSEEILMYIDSILPSKDTSLQPCTQKQSSIEEYFSSVNETFDKFSHSRASLRNFSETEIAMTDLISALDLARTTPSACNRQSWRVHVFADKEKISEILAVQGGNRGFGHLTNKLVIITGELGVYGHAFERNQVFVDGGMYAMNLLYALHFRKIGACILNCSTSPEKDSKLYRLCGVNKSEVFIAMIACGSPVQSFKIPVSPRYELDKLVKF